jgi:enoyl-CoA hydratase/carnithine racemase
MNLEVFAGLVDEPSRTRSELGALRELLDAVRTAEVVTIAAINGHCLGAAFELALACDFRIAKSGSLLGLPEIKLGLPCILDSALLQQYVGLAFAKEMILTGRLYPAERLADAGVVTVVKEDAALIDEVDALLAEFADTSRVAIASQKRVFDAWQNLSLDAANERSLDEITLVFEHNETRSRLSNYTAQLKARDRERIPPP